VLPECALKVFPFEPETVTKWKRNQYTSRKAFCIKVAQVGKIRTGDRKSIG
jgi:hypothetical protein